VRLPILVSLLVVPLTVQAQTLVAGNLKGPAEMPTGDKLLNINQTPVAPRFLNLETKWPEKPGDTSVCLWADDKVAAWSIEIDDNYNEDIPWWEDQSKARGGLPLTWFVITGTVGKYVPHTGTWDVFQRLLGEGFHAESHTVTHFIHLDPNWQGVEWDYSQAIKDLDTNLPNHTTHFLAYPGGANPNPNDRDIAAKYYMAARGTQGTPVAANLIDYLCVNGYHPVVGNPKASWADPSNVLLEKNPNPGNQRYYRGWTNMFWHGVNHKPGLSPLDPGSEACAIAVLDWITANKTDLWGGFFGDVAMYGEERDTATLTPGTSDPSKITFSLTSRMDPALYTFPLTVKVRLPDGWTGVAATQAGKTIDASVIDHDNAHFALVKAVPGAGDVALVSAK
jgi:hypothetical protein